MSKIKKFTDEDFKEGISGREAYIHSLYYVSMSTGPGASATLADHNVGFILKMANDLYPPDVLDAIRQMANEWMDESETALDNQVNEDGEVMSPAYRSQMLRQGLCAAQLLKLLDE